MELTTRALAGVIAAWIPMDAGDDGRRSQGRVQTEMCDARLLDRKIAMVQSDIAMGADFPNRGLPPTKTPA